MRRDDRGIALVEFALLLPIIIVTLIGLFDVALAVWQSNTLGTAVREGTRYAIVHGASSDTPVSSGGYQAVTDTVLRYTVGVPNVTVTATWPDGSNARGKRVSVVATAPHTPVLSQAFLGGALTVTLRAGSELVIHR